MCGILVTAGFSGAFHHRQLKSLRKRGPDEIGFWSNESVKMAHTRLAIIGLDDRSTEPMENDAYVLVYNGEVYNFLDIKDRLAREGIILTAANDAEVLLHAWTLWGPKILTEIAGFWAFVLYDKSRNKLTLVRDQLGIKPLYYWHSNGGVCVSSMIGTILNVVGQSRELDYAAISEYVRYQFTFGDKTLLNRLKKFSPGTLSKSLLILMKYQQHVTKTFWLLLQKKRQNLRLNG